LVQGFGFLGLLLKLVNMIFNFFLDCTNFCFEIGHYCVSMMGFERVGTGFSIQMICLGD
jgi:hypothetical protein